TYIVGFGRNTIVELAGQGIDTVRTSINYTLGINLENLVLADTLVDVLRFVDSGETVSLTRIADEANPLVGTWHFADSLGETAITFLADGSYLLAEDGAPDSSGQPGMEHGTYSWNAASGAFTSTTITDTNGEWGLSHSSITSVEISGATLTVPDAGETIILTRVVDADNPLVGAWHFADSLGEAAITFLADGSYLLAEDGAPDSSGQAGMEHGTYIWNAATGAFTSTTITDTNGEWGLSNDSPLSNIRILQGNGTGNALNNVIEGNEADNILSGLAGNDTLLGNGGHDTLNGGAGNDRLDGGTGDDLMIGGTGDDTFV